MQEKFVLLKPNDVCVKWWWIIMLYTTLLNYYFLVEWWVKN